MRIFSQTGQILSGDAVFSAFGGKSVCFLKRRALLRQTEQREELGGAYGVADQSKLRPRNWKESDQNASDVAGRFV